MIGWLIAGTLAVLAVLGTVVSLCALIVGSRFER